MQLPFLTDVNIPVKATLHFSHNARHWTKMCIMSVFICAMCVCVSEIKQVEWEKEKWKIY